MILIAAPIGDGKEYSINEYFKYIVNQDIEDVEVAICVNGKSEKSIKEKIALLKQVELTHKSGKKIPLHVLELEYVESYSLHQRLYYSREKIREFATEKFYTHLFYMDTDTIPNFPSAIKRLKEHNVDFISGVYFYKGSKQPVVVGIEGVNVSLDTLKTYYDKDEIFKIWGCGYGCLLLSYKLFSTCKFDWETHKDDWSEDFAHSEVVEKNGFDRWCDPKVVCRHYRAEDFKIG